MPNKKGPSEDRHQGIRAAPDRDGVARTLADGMAIPIEQRSQDEVLVMRGRGPNGEVVPVEIAASGSPARNDAFDVTPARLVTGFITERGLCAASETGLRELYPEAPASRTG